MKTYLKKKKKNIHPSFMSSAMAEQGNRKGRRGEGEIFHCLRFTPRQSYRSYSRAARRPFFTSRKRGGKEQL